MRVNIQKIKKVGKEKNIMIIRKKKYNMKENLKKEKKMEKEKNIPLKVIYYMKVNI